MKRRKEPRPKPAGAKPLSAHEAGKLSPRIRETAAPADGIARPATATLKSPLDHLTPGEMEVLRAMAERLGNLAIAEQRDVLVSTVEKHIENIYAKLRVNTRADAIAIYLHDERASLRRDREALVRQQARLSREGAARQAEIDRLQRQVDSLMAQVTALRTQLRKGL